MSHGPFVVTGVGAVSAWGWGVEPLWRGLRSGRTAIGRLERFAADDQRTDRAAQVPPAPPAVEAATELAAGGGGGALADRFALAAAREAVAGAGLGPDGPAPRAAGVFFGGSTAGMIESEELFRKRLAGEGAGPPTRSALAPLAAQPLDNPAAAVARMLGVCGPVLTVSSACASGTQALGLALDALRSGEVDVAFAGGADSLCRLTYSGFNALRVVDAVACRPFRDGRAGMTLGEGAGVLVIEPLDRFLARTAGREPGPIRPLPRVLAELRGVGNSCDAHHMTAPRPDGLGAALATRRALADAGIAPTEVAFVNAHGTGTPLNDASEWKGLERVFGPRAGELPVTATKASVGHLLGSSGAIEAVATVLCLDAGEVHPTPQPEDAAAAAVDPEIGVRLVVGEPLRLDSIGAGAVRPRRAALSTSFGFGGANAAALLLPPPVEVAASQEVEPAAVQPEDEPEEGAA